MTPVLRDIAGRLQPFGLVARGGFHPVADDAVPPLAGGSPAATVVMIGNVGQAGGDPMWARFAAARGADAGPDPMNRWTRDIIDPMARALGAAALYPFGGPPHLPFQRWAMRAEPVAPSPIGLLIHPEFGLWHAYRAALAFGATLDLPPRQTVEPPCSTCDAKPCLGACPVQAFDAGGYDVQRCAGHLDKAEGSDCMERACRARRACPVGAERAQETGQARFHMRAFRRGVGLGSGLA